VVFIHHRVIVKMQRWMLKHHWTLVKKPHSHKMNHHSLNQERRRKPLNGQVIG